MSDVVQLEAARRERRRRRMIALDIPDYSDHDGFLFLCSASRDLDAHIDATLRESQADVPPPPSTQEG